MKHTKIKSIKKLTTAINKMCKECIYDSGNGSWRKQVEKCSSYKCPLYIYRPTTEEKNV